MSLSKSYHGQNREEVVMFLPKSYSKVLEVGCGEGTFLRYINPDAEVWGIEPNKLAANKASEIYHVVYNDFFDNVLSEIPDNYFDLVICNDVIEHMADHNDFFNKIKNKMTSHGFIVGSVPNVRFINNLFNLLILKDWRYKESGVLDYTHLRFFTEKSLKKTFLDNGFGVKMFEGLNSVFVRKYTKNIIIENAVTFIIILFSFGFYSDVRFVQFGFQLQKK